MHNITPIHNDSIQGVDVNHSHEKIYIEIHNNTSIGCIELHLTQTQARELLFKLGDSLDELSKRNHRDCESNSQSNQLQRTEATSIQPV